MDDPDLTKIKHPKGVYLDPPILTNPAKRYLENSRPGWHGHDLYAQPTELWDYATRAGMIAAGMEIESYARIVESIGGTTFDEVTRFTVSSALRALLTSLGIIDDVNSAYDEQVNQLRASSGLASSQPATGDVADRGAEDPRVSPVSLDAYLDRRAPVLEELPSSPVVGSDSWTEVQFEKHEPTSEEAAQGIVEVHIPRGRSAVRHDVSDEGASTPDERESEGDPRLGA